MAETKVISQWLDIAMRLVDSGYRQPPTKTIDIYDGDILLVVLATEECIKTFQLIVNGSDPYNWQREYSIKDRGRRIKHVNPLLQDVRYDGILIEDLLNRLIDIEGTQ